MKGFEDLKKEVIDTELCTRCGTCIGVCPVQTLAYQGDAVVDAQNQCIKCGRCLAVCPGKDYRMDNWAEKIFQKPYDAKNLLGIYQSIWNVYSKQEKIRKEGASGGVVTQLLIDLLKENIIEGAVTLRRKADSAYEFEPFIALNAEQIISAAQSKYVVIPANQIIGQIRQWGKKVAFVGLPCQIQGMRRPWNMIYG